MSNEEINPVSDSDLALAEAMLKINWISTWSGATRIVVWVPWRVCELHQNEPGVQPYTLDTSKEPLSFEVFCIHMNWFSRWFFPTVVDHYKSVYWEQRWILKFREENPELNGELRKYFQMRHEGESISPEIKKKLYDAYLIIIWYDEVDSTWNVFR